MSGHLSRLRLVAVLVILSSLLREAHTQTNFPHIALRGTILRNNSWIDITALFGDDKLLCLTDLDSCCNEDTDQRSWILPNGTEEIASFVISAGQRQLGLSLLDHRPVGNTALPGVYECSIATRSAAAESVYVGIYHNPVDIGETRVCIQTVIRCHDELTSALCECKDKSIYMDMYILSLYAIIIMIWLCVFGGPVFQLEF